MFPITAHFNTSHPATHKQQVAKASQDYTTALLLSESSQQFWVSNSLLPSVQTGSLSNHAWLCTLLLKGYFRLFCFSTWLLKLFPIWVPFHFKHLLETFLLLWLFLLLRAIFELSIPLVFLKAWIYLQFSELIKLPALTLWKKKKTMLWLAFFIQNIHLQKAFFFLLISKTVERWVY